LDARRLSSATPSDTRRQGGHRRVSEALERLDRAGTDSLLLGQISASNPDYVCMVFLTDDPPTLVACVGIARPA
jgi:hypothetical protein